MPSRPSSCPRVVRPRRGPAHLPSPAMAVPCHRRRRLHGGRPRPPGDGPGRARIPRRRPTRDVILVGRRQPLAQALGDARRRPARACACTRHAKWSRWTSRRPTRCARRRTRRCASRSTWCKDGEAHACVSAGNTGALMAIARFVLKTLPGIDRPAIASLLPTMQGRHVRARPRRQRRLHARAPAAVRRHGRDAGRRGRAHRAPDASACSTSARRTSRATTS